MGSTLESDLVKKFAFVLRTGLARRSLTKVIVICMLLLNHEITGLCGPFWIGMSVRVHYLKIEVTKYIFSLLRIFKIAQQNQGSCDLIAECNTFRIVLFWLNQTLLLQYSNITERNTASCLFFVCNYSKPRLSNDKWKWPIIF